MTLKDVMAADTSTLISTDEFAYAVTYTDKDGVDTAINAVLFEVVTQQETNNGVNTIVHTRAMSFATDDLEVDMRGTVTIDSVDWAITDRLFQDDVITTVELKRHELYETGRPNLRRQ